VDASAGPEAKREREAASPPAREASGEKAAPGLSAVQVTLRDQSQIPGRLRELRNERLTVDHASLGTVGVSLSEVLEIAFQSGKARYLSDMEPSAVREERGLLFDAKKLLPYRRDRNVLGQPLSLNGRRYRKGLGVHSYCLIEYPLGGAYARFLATVGLDDSARPPSFEMAKLDVGSVVFRVKVDGKVVWEKPMTWRDAPAAVDLPLTGAKALALEVDYGAGGVPGLLTRDRADWAEARVVK